MYLDWSRYQDSVPIYERSLQIYESVFGSSHPFVAQVLNSMAGVQQEMGHYEEAEKVYHRTLEMREKLLGPAHPDVALTVNDIAVLYSRQEKFNDALVYYQRALEIRLAVVGDKHPDYAQALSTCAFPLFLSFSTRFHRVVPLREYGYGVSRHGPPCRCITLI